MSSLNETKNQEAADIFGSLNELNLHLQEPVFASSARLKARKQLDVSEDSPFKKRPEELSESQLKQLREEKAKLLRRETDEIKRQLDLVKNRLAELKIADNSDKSSSSSSSETGSKDTIVDKIERDEPKQHKVNAKSSPPANLRPLTGKADCPNCRCDRRASVCDECIQLNQVVRQESNFHTFERPASKRPPVIDNDERPIRPAREKIKATVEVVDELVVPNKVYTISRSLNDKRTKLAQAIDELQQMMDQVKKREEQLEKERKIVHLYKEQWKYGPTIGGPAASARDRLGHVNSRRNYESRLDSNLSRDTNSLMGFQHIESSMRLRQYNLRQVAGRKSTASQHARSKSLESLNRLSAVRRSDKTAIATPPRANRNKFSNVKSASAVDLALPPAEEDKVANEEDEDNIAEELEENQDFTKEDEQGSRKSTTKQNKQQVAAGLAGDQQSKNDNQNNDRLQKLSWVPVFGETEIKTTKRPEPKRKILIVDPKAKTNFAIDVPTKTASPSPRTGLVRSKSSFARPTVAPNRTIVEANRRLTAATELLNQEQRDSGTRNQILVNRRPFVKPIPRPRVSLSTTQQRTRTIAQNNLATSGGVNRSSLHNSSARPTTTQQTSIKSLVDPNGELFRLEEKIMEQQRMLTRLLESQQEHQRQIYSPVTVRCSPSPCCRPTPMKSRSPMRPNSLNEGHSISSPRQLVHSLRERLNKTKTRLAKTLEEEREKHQQLKSRVDSSLRKQTDLEAENELLKQSLGRCIDTCLKDISSTFESLGDTLADSMTSIINQAAKEAASGGANTDTANTQGPREVASKDGDESRSMLTNAAQLIADNRHLKQMKSHIETIERQRKSIFEELSYEKQRSSQLELQMQQLAEANKRLEAQLDKLMIIPKPSTSGEQAQSAVPVTGQQNNDLSSVTENQTDNNDKSQLSDDTYNSIELYKRYIESMSPDIEAIRRERRMILSEFDNIKKMLSDISSGSD